jgi:hypothetical protein
MASDWMHARCAALGSAHRQSALVELDLLPLEAAHLRSPQAMTIGDKDHGCIALAMPIALGGFDQPLNLALGEVAAFDCEVLSAWCCRPLDLTLEFASVD